MIRSQTLGLEWLPGIIRAGEGPLLSQLQPDVSYCPDHEKRSPCLPKQRIYLASVGFWINPLVAQTHNPSLVVQGLLLSSTRHKDAVETKPGGYAALVCQRALPLLISFNYYLYFSLVFRLT